MFFTAPTDRAYGDTTHAVEILDPILRRRIRLEKEHSRTTVVWNPWIAGAHALPDMADDEWRAMACVEASNMRAFGVDLAPGEQHTMKTSHPCCRRCGGSQLERFTMSTMINIYD